MSLTSERLAPDTLALQTNLTGAVAAIQDDPDSPGGTWLTATSAVLVINGRATFPSPAFNPNGAQNFRVLVRKTAGTPSPTLIVELWQAGVFRKTLVAGQAITSTTGEVVQGDWNSSDLVGTLDGSDVEVRVASLTGDTVVPGGIPANAASAGAAATNATITTALTVSKPASANAGFLMILQVLHRNDASDGAGPATITGWTPFPGNPYGGANNARQSLYWRISTGAEGGQTVSVTCTGTTTNGLAHARIYKFTAGSDGWAANPIEAIATATGTASPLLAATVVTGGLRRYALAMSALASSDSVIGNMTGESGGDWADILTAATTTGGDGTINQQGSTMASGGTLTGGSIAFSTTTSSHWTSVCFALVPADVTTIVNTLEIGALEWNALSGTSDVTGAGSAAGVASCTTASGRNRTGAATAAGAGSCSTASGVARGGSATAAGTGSISTASVEARVGAGSASGAASITGSPAAAYVAAGSGAGAGSTSASSGLIIPASGSATCETRSAAAHPEILIGVAATATGQAATTGTALLTFGVSATADGTSDATVAGSFEISASGFADGFTFAGDPIPLLSIGGSATATGQAAASTTSRLAIVSRATAHGQTTVMADPWLEVAFRPRRFIFTFERLSKRHEINSRSSRVRT